MTGVFISWTRQNGRTADLALALGLTPEYVYLESPLGLPGRYARQLRATRTLLRRTAPARAVLMLPPAPALLSFLGSRRHRPERLVFDLHTGFFLDPKWAWSARPALRLMRRLGGTAIVTGDALRRECERAGVPAVVLHDAIGEAEPPREHSGFLLCPLSYANDEPVAEILAAAALTPDIEWRLTGRAPEPVVAAAPPNVTFTGFVSDVEYSELVRASLAVVALTTRARTMQRAGYEAFSAGVPHITSDFPELREFYAESGVFAVPAAHAIVAAVRDLAERRAALVAALVRVRAIRIGEQRRDLDAVRAALGLEPRFEGGNGHGLGHGLDRPAHDQPMSGDA